MAGKLSDKFQFMRFFGVSTIGTAADYLSALALHGLFGVAGGIAATIGFLIGTTINYCGHTKFTFDNGQGSGLSVGGYFKYLVAVGASLLVRLAVLYAADILAIAPFWFNLAVAFAISFVCSYVISVLWVFKDAEK